MKKLHCFLFFVVTILMGGNLMAQQDLDQLMYERGEYYFTISVQDPSQIQELCMICSVDGTDGQTVVAYANQEEYDKILNLGYEPILQMPPSLRANVTMWDGQGTYNWNSYLTYDQYVAMMQGFPTKALEGRTCTLFSLGTLSTSNHRQLLGVRINNGSPEGKPKFLYSSTMHGDEITGMILMLRLIDLLCTSTDDQVVNLVNNLDIYILPLTNPDGTYKGGNSTVNSAQRYNGYNRDLNRNYKDYFMGDHPDGNSYQDETLWTMAFADSLLFTMGGNYHGGAEVMNYPWDPVYTDHADKNWYEYTCTRYVQVARQTYSSYMTDTYSDGVTNGATWYTISGSRQDYMNAYGQCREVTVECSSTKTPSGSSLPNYWNYNHYAMLAFMEEALYGVHGFVYNAVTGASIEGVTVTVENHDINNSYVTTHAVGDFHRPIKGGTYTFTFAKEGYYSQSVQVTVTDGHTVNLNIQLQPILQTITATASPAEGGTIEGAGFYDLGETCTLTATAADNYQFIRWTEDGQVVSTDNPYSFEVGGDRDLVAVFASTIPVSITVSASPTRAGAVSGGGEFMFGETCMVTATPNDGYAFTNWTENGTVVSEDMEYSFEVTTERELVANFIFEATEPKDCYFPVNSISAGNYVMGYLNSSTLIVPTHNNTSTVTTTSTTVTPTDYGFSVEEGTSIPQVTLTANNGQYNISYNNRYLTASSSGGGYNPTYNLTWSNSTYNITKWNINGNSIYMTVNGWNSGTYYLYYDTSTNAFKLSSTSQDNITFYTEGECPAVSYTITATANPSDGGTIEGADNYFYGETCTLMATANEGYTFINWTEDGEEVSSNPVYSFEVTGERTLVANFEEAITTIQQTISLSVGWNWWSPNFEMEGTALLSALEGALGTNGTTIKSINQSTLYYSQYNMWYGTLNTLVPERMYMIEVTEACTITLTGAPVNPADHPITVNPGSNWIGCPTTVSVPLSTAFVGFTPQAGDVIKTRNASATYYENYGWYGTLETLEPGKGYIYQSNATGPVTFTLNPNAK